MVDWNFALAYVELGWAVFPLYSARDGACACPRGKECGSPGKHPRTRHGHKCATTDKEKIRQWWEKHPDSNIGIATGRSSGLLIIDVDPRNGGDKGLEELIQRLGQPPRGPLVKTGGGGWHLYYQYPGQQAKKPARSAPGIDIKGDGGYVVAPGSIHASGRPYVWQVPPQQAPLPALSDAWLAWLNPKFYTSGASYTSSASNSSHASSSSVSSYPAHTLILEKRQQADEPLDEYVQFAIEATTPGTIGQRRKQLFRFLKRLKQHPDLAGESVQAIRSYVIQWHKRALPNIGTKPFTETWTDAAGAWDRIDDREGLLNKLYNEASREPPPSLVSELGYEDDPVAVGLVVLCRALQRHNGSEPFFLSARDAARIVNTSPTTVSQLMRMLRTDEVLELVTSGDLRERKASEYRYLR